MDGVRVDKSRRLPSVSRLQAAGLGVRFHEGRKAAVGRIASGAIDRPIDRSISRARGIIREDRTRSS